MSYAKQIALEAALKRIAIHGPDRVLTRHGSAINPKRALEWYNTTADVIFIRDDGWSLGAAADLEDEARKIWADCWIAILRKGNDKPEIL